MLQLTDPRAFTRLVEMEGEQWASLQRRKPEAPYSFFRLLQAWQAKVAAGYESDPDYPVSDFMEGPSPSNVLYGEGGWRRYAVRADGELVLLRESARAESCTKAETLGIRVF